MLSEPSSYASLLSSLALMALVVANCTENPVRGDSFEQQRERMVKDQLEQRGIRDPRVLDALGRVPRHLFVSPDLQPYAYEDHPLPIGVGQTISQPYIVALMTELARVGSKDVVLEVGTGSGYQAAVLAVLAKRVYTIEYFEELARSASQRLKELKYNNVEVQHGDGSQGWPEHQPFDAILVTAAAGEVPPPLLDQLKPGGRLVIPVGSEPSSSMLQLIEKSKDGRVSRRDILPVRFVPLR